MGCTALGLDRGCQSSHQASSDGSATLVPSAPNRPIVTYTAGKLTVTARNTSLGEVLRAISAQTGIVIDFPAGGVADRIAVRESERVQ